MSAGWLTPMVSGVTATYAHEGIVHAGVCALTNGKATNVAAIVNTRNVAIVVAAILFLDDCIFFSP
jgi:uncharacterized membrane protein